MLSGHIVCVCVRDSGVTWLRGPALSGQQPSTTFLGNVVPAAVSEDQDELHKYWGVRSVWRRTNSS